MSTEDYYIQRVSVAGIIMVVYMVCDTFSD